MKEGYFLRAFRSKIVRCQRTNKMAEMLLKIYLAVLYVWHIGLELAMSWNQTIFRPSTNFFALTILFFELRVENWSKKSFNCGKHLVCSFQIWARNLFWPTQTEIQKAFFSFSNIFVTSPCENFMVVLMLRGCLKTWTLRVLDLSYIFFSIAKLPNDETQPIRVVLKGYMSFFDLSDHPYFIIS